ncbi:MAG: hypothetical protein PQJ59_08680 [Spirochaetales bacterium]|nr:hypothetical protein [Spirochaetales bacterium]
MRRIFPVLILFLLGMGILWAGDRALFYPEEGLSLFFPDPPAVPLDIQGGEDLILSYDGFSLLLERSFNFSHRTLLQLYYESSFYGGDSSLVNEVAGEGTTSFSRPWLGGTLTYSPLVPDRVEWLGSARETVSFSHRPEGILLFFEAGGDFFWLGNGSDFFCYDRQGFTAARYSLDQTALLSTSDGEGNLYLCFSDATLCSLPPVQSEGDWTLRNFNGTELILTYYEEARKSLEGDQEGFDLWILGLAEKLYREDPLNRELGAFVRKVKENRF